MAPRLSLTRSQLATAVGLELAQFLESITADGKIDASEAHALADWLLKNQGSDFPAVGHLLTVLNKILEDGRIDSDELAFLQTEIEAVLPPELRRAAQLKRRQAATQERALRAAEADEAKRALAALRPVGSFDFCVAGVAYDGRGQFIDKNLERLDGAEVEFKRMPDNPFDKNAILLTAFGGELGYVPRGEAEWIAEFLDGGHRYKATVKRVHSGGRFSVPVIWGDLFSPGNKSGEGKLAAQVSFQDNGASVNGDSDDTGLNKAGLTWILFFAGVIVIFLLFNR